MFKIKISALAVLGLGLAGAASAAIIGNGPPNQSGGSDLNGFLEGDNFTVSTSATITQVKYWTLQSTAADYSGTTSWGFYSDAAGVPGVALFSGSAVATGVATGLTALGLPEFSYTFTTNVAITPGNYWLVLHNGPNGTIPSTNYNWEWSSATGNSRSKDLSFSGAPWVSNSAELAFQLTAVPEPASLFLVAGGLMAAWFVRRKISSKA